MTLTTCSECGHEISAQAKACPSCGNPITKKTSGVAKGCLFALLAFVLLVGIGGLLENKPASKPTSSAVPQKQTTQVKVPPKPKVISSVTFNEVNNLFGAKSNLTDLQKDEKWKQYEGLCVEWSGVLSSLDEDLLGNIKVGMRHLRSTMTSDVLISAPDEQRANLLNWTEGKTYKYRATLDDYGGIFSAIWVDWGC